MMNKHRHDGPVIKDFTAVEDACSWYAAHFEQPSETTVPSQALLRIVSGPAAPCALPSIGIIGVSYPATRDFLHRIAEATGYNGRYLVHTRDFYSCYGQAQAAGDWRSVGRYVRNSGEQLASAGAEILCMPANTTHKAEAIAPLMKHLPVNTIFVSMIEAVVDAAVQMDCRKVAILGTEFTMQASFYPDAFTSSGKGAQAILPARHDDIQAISNAIFARMLKNVWLEEDALLCNAVMERMANEQQADSVALACTELPMLYANTGVPSLLPAIDTTQSLTLAVAEACMAT